MKLQSRIDISLRCEDKVINWVIQSSYHLYWSLIWRSCGYASGDKDKDGVADMFDKEPDTPWRSKVYGDGTSVDTDGDGVPDVKKTLNLFSAKGAKVDANGHEIDNWRQTEFQTAATSSRLLLKEVWLPIQELLFPTGPANKGGTSSILAANGYLPSIFFDLNSSVIAPKYNETLASIALVMRNNPDIKFDISGNCDSRASDDYNLWNSENAALKQWKITCEKNTISTQTVWTSLHLERKNQSQKITDESSCWLQSFWINFYESIMRGSLLRAPFFLVVGWWLMVVGMWFRY